MKEYILNKNWYFHIEDEEFKNTGDIEKRDVNTSYGLQKAGQPRNLRHVFLNITHGVR